MIFTLIGILSSIVFLIADIPYFRDTLQGTTKPQRVTWGIVFLLNAIGFANQYASGATNSLWLFGMAVFATGAIFLASLFKGVGGHSKLDLITITIAFGGLALWAIFDSPVLSIIATLVVGIVSLLPTFAKAKREPETETRITWLLGSISAVLATISVGELNWQLLILPINAALLQGYMVYILYFKTNK